MGQVTIQIGGDTTALPYATPAYPIVQWSSLAVAGDTIASAASRLTANSVLQLPPGTFILDTDFIEGGGDFEVYPGKLLGIIGAGSAETILTMPANTMSATTISKVPSQSSGGTNPLYMLRVGISSSTTSTPYLSGFTLAGTPQQALYNGLYVYHATDAFLNDIKVTGIPGNNSSPPGETFGINDYDSVGSVYVNCEVDGRNPAGVAVGSAGFGTNGSTNVTRVNCSSHHSGFGAGFTEFQNTGFTFINCSSYANAKSGFNFERASGQVVMSGCVTTGNQHQLIIDSDQTNPATFHISDPVTDVPGTLTILQHHTYSWPPGTPNPNTELAPGLITVTGASLQIINN